MNHNKFQIRILMIVQRENQRVKCEAEMIILRNKTLGNRANKGELVFKLKQIQILAVAMMNKNKFSKICNNHKQVNSMMVNQTLNI